jgi:Spy/CpxP family protein refolding chaperone
MRKCLLNITLALIATMPAVAQQDVPPGGPPEGMGGPGGPGGPGKMMMRLGPPPFDWWRNSELAQKLNLTDQQKQQLEQTFNQQRLQLVDLRAALEKEEIKLRDLMDSENFNESQAMAQIDTTQAARNKLMRSFASMAVQFRKILTAQQWKMLRDQEVMRFHRQPPIGDGAPPKP